jgi:hypothetical protein
LFAMAKALLKDTLISSMENVALNQDLGGWQIEFRGLTYGSFPGVESHTIVTVPAEVGFSGILTDKPATKGARRARRLRDE